MVTPHGKHDRLGSLIGVPNLFFKREDLHPYGSHKGRSIPYMIDKYRSEGKTAFAISSSGNAALAAGFHIQNLNRDFPDDKITLSIFIGNHINPEKESILREKLKDPLITIEKVERPKQSLTDAIHAGKASLRQSTSEDALVGYFDLARELNTIPHLAAVFIATSSGTTAEALARAFEKIAPHTHIHIVQTSACFPISEALGASHPAPERSIADAIVDTTAFRKQAIVTLLRKNKGYGWVATNSEILEAMRMIETNTGIPVSPNGALAFAGLVQARKKKMHFPGSVACIIGGK